TGPPVVCRRSGGTAKIAVAVRVPPFPRGTAPDQRFLRACLACRGAQPGEQVALGQRCPRRVAGPDEAFRAEGVLGNVSRNFAEPRFLDLAGMSEQGFPLLGQRRPDVN